MTGGDRTDPRPSERSLIMTPTLLWILPALALLACGWFASAWFYKRKLDALHGQVKAIRHTAAEHASQARRQIGQLQAELATRLPAPRRATRQAAGRGRAGSADGGDHEAEHPGPRIRSDGDRIHRLPADAGDGRLGFIAHCLAQCEQAPASRRAPVRARSRPYVAGRTVA